MKMNNDRLKAIKDSIVVAIDYREQKNMHILEKLSEKRILISVINLKYADYSFWIPENKELGINEPITFWDKVAIEKKAHLTEISNNFTKGRIQFDTEFQKAKNDGCKIHLVIEESDGRKKIKHRQEIEIEIEKLKNKIKEYENKIDNEICIFAKQILIDKKTLLEQSLNMKYDFAFRKTWRSRFCANAMIGSLKAFKERYNLDVIFCKKTETADKMLEIFYKAIDNYFGDKE